MLDCLMLTKKMEDFTSFRTKDNKIFHFMAWKKDFDAKNARCQKLDAKSQMLNQT